MTTAPENMKPKTKPSANWRAFNGTLFKPKVVELAKPAQPATINGRPWWAVAPRDGLTAIARGRQGAKGK